MNFGGRIAAWVGETMCFGMPLLGKFSAKSVDLVQFGPRSRVILPWGKERGSPGVHDGRR